jgi:hypothetical protein
MTSLPVMRVVLYKHGVGYFERQGSVEGDETLSLTFKQAEVSDVLKSLTVLDLDGGHIASVSYDSTKPPEQLLDEVALSIPDEGSLVGLLPQIKGARLAVQPPGSGEGPVEGVLLGVDVREQHTADGVVKVVLVSLLEDAGAVRSFELHALERLEILDATLRRDLDHYLRIVLAAKKKDRRTFSFFARGEGKRTIRISYTLESPVWKATYRILLGEEDRPPLIQGWAVVDNTQDEDWESVQLSLVSGLPVSFVHDLYTPRYLRRPVVAVEETTGVLPPEVEQGMESLAVAAAAPAMLMEAAAGGGGRRVTGELAPPPAEARKMRSRSAASSTPAQVRERKLGDLFEYEIEHPVTIKRNQSALVPIVLRGFEGRPVLLHNRATRANNPMRSVDFKNTTGLTLEGGPVTVLEGGSYVGEAMLDTLKPDEHRLVPYAVELSVFVLDNVDSHDESVHKVVIRNGWLTRHTQRVQQMMYHFDNKSATEQTLYLDHARGGNEWELFDTPAPVETTENHWRFRFVLPAKKVTGFVVKQRRSLANSVALSGMSTNDLAVWLDQKHVDRATEKVLRQVIALQQQLGEQERVLKRLQEERSRIHEEQGRIRENMQALGDRSSEKELRERFVRTFNSQEDRLEQISAEIDTRTAERDGARERVNPLLAGLEYEGTR